MNSRRYRIGISGSYGGMNLGDEAILEGILSQLRATIPADITADPALLLDPEELSRDALKAEGVEFDRHLVGFSVREPGPAAPDIDPEEYYALLANAADFVVKRYDADVVFVPMERTDVQHSHAVVAHMQKAERAEILKRRYSPRQILKDWLVRHPGGQELFCQGDVVGRSKKQSLGWGNAKKQWCASAGPPRCGDERRGSRDFSCWKHFRLLVSPLSAWPAHDRLIQRSSGSPNASNGRIIPLG